MNRRPTKQEVLDAINAYFGDTSRSREETLDGLDEIISHAESMHDALKEELAN